MLRHLKTFALMAALAAALRGAPPNDRGEVQLQAAMKKELVDGDLRAAIEEYKKIVAAHPDNRGIAAKALLQMGQCYEKLGSAEANKAYERLLREYPDQREAAEARSRLAAVTGSGMVVKRVSPALPDMVGGGESISPDGRYMAGFDYSTYQLAVLDINTGKLRHIGDRSPIGSVLAPVFSPDGQRIVYSWSSDDQQQLRIVRADGSDLRVLVKNRNMPLYPAAWSPDGKTIAARWPDKRQGTGQPSSVKIALVSAADGTVRMLKSLPRTGLADIGGFSPDGKYLVCAAKASEESASDFFVIATDGSHESPVVSEAANDWNAKWSPDGRHIVFLSTRSGSTALWAVPVAAGKPTGAPELVSSSINETGCTNVTARCIVLYGFKPDGALFYNQFTQSLNIDEIPLDRDTGRPVGQAKRIVTRFVGKNTQAVWSPDGERFAFWSSRPGGQVMVVQSAKTGEERVFPDSGAARTYSRNIRWYPDGQSLLVPDTDRAQRQHVLRRIDTQTGQSRIVARLPWDAYPGGVEVARDGKELYYSIPGEAGDSFRILRRDLETGSEKEICREASNRLATAIRLSPDGRQLALLVPGVRALSPADSGAKVMVVPADGGEPKLVSRGVTEILPFGGIAWSPDSRHIVLRRGLSMDAGELVRVSIDGGQPESLGSAPPAGFDYLSISPDGGKLLVNENHGRTELWTARNLLSDLNSSR